jgi:hypothetical protein
MLALTDDSKLLHATIQTGSNMDVEWFAYGNESQREITPGNPQVNGKTCNRTNNGYDYVCLVCLI